MKPEYKYFLSGLVISALGYSGINGAEIISTANAESKAKQCVWSYINDKGAPNIGEAGKIEMDEDWTKMSNSGWKLKLCSGNIWVFEKCE